MNPNINTMNQMNYVGQFEAKQFYPYPVPHQVTAIQNQPYVISSWGMPQYSIYPTGPMYPPQFIARPQPMMQQPMEKFVPLRMEGMSDADLGSIQESRYSSSGQIKPQPLGIVPNKVSLSENDLYMLAKPSQSSGSQNLSIHQGAPGLIKQNTSGKDLTNKVAKPKQFSSPKLQSNIEGVQKSLKDWSSDTNMVMNVGQLRQPEDINSREVKTVDQSDTDINDFQNEGQDQLDKEGKSVNSKTSSSKKSKRKGKNKTEKRKRERFSGRLKFFDEAKNYGFLVLDSDGSDMFVHFDDLRKTNINKDLLVSSKTLYSMHFTFHVFEYDGKYKSSKKAVDIKLVSILKLDPIEETEISEPVLWAKNIAPETEITESMLSNFFNS